MTEQELQKALEISHGFDAGNYASAYETEDLETALAPMVHQDPSPEYRAAFILGFFSSYSLHEIPSSDRDAYDDAYWSEAGKAVIAAGYCDDRAAEYTTEERAMGTI
jgi:hypothetical protein